MKRFVFALLLAVSAAASVVPVQAQTDARVSATEIDAERTRIAAARAVVNKKALDERTACYQQFAVQGCLIESRRRQRVTLDQLKRDEARINEITRRERGSAALERLDRKASPERAETSQERQERSRKEQQGREDRAATHATSRASAASEIEQKQRAFDNKQRRHAARQASEAAHDARAPKMVEDHDTKLRRAAEHQEQRARQNADRKKPRGAPLPPPPAS